MLADVLQEHPRGSSEGDPGRRHTALLPGGTWQASEDVPGKVALRGEGGASW